MCLFKFHAFHHFDDFDLVLIWLASYHLERLSFESRSISA
jgi:hypothetical protein